MNLLNTAVLFNSGDGLVGLLIHLLILILVLGIIWWVITMIPMPPPMGQIVRVIFGVICAIILIYFLLGLTGCSSMGTIATTKGGGIAYTPNAQVQCQRNRHHQPMTMGDK